MRSNESHTMHNSQDNIAIPIIDLEPMRSGTSPEATRTSKDVFEAFRGVGFAYIKNHGVPQPLIDQMFEWVSSFK